jgi:hypothetical protein
MFTSRNDKDIFIHLINSLLAVQISELSVLCFTSIGCSRQCMRQIRSARHIVHHAALCSRQKFFRHVMKHRAGPSVNGFISWGRFAAMLLSLLNQSSTCSLIPHCYDCGITYNTESLPRSTLSRAPPKNTHYSRWIFINLNMSLI